MALERRIFADYRDENEPSRYPFADEATLRTVSGLYTIAVDAFLDASVYAVGLLESAYVSEIVVEPRRVTLHIGDAGTARRCFARFDPFGTGIYQLQLVDTLGRDCGVLVSDPDRLAVFSTWALGSHTFTTTATPLAASCVLPLPEIGVRGILTAKGELLTGDVWLIGDNGVVLRDEEGEIRVDIVGDPLFVRKACVPQGDYQPPRVLRTLNNCGPDAYGNTNLTVSDEFSENTILRIYPDGSGLRIEAVGKQS